jgi:tRNA pseudouridine13 synthase
MNQLPYLTRDLPGIGGRIKERIEDFRVEEIPLYQPSGRGTHTYFTVAKTGIPTNVAADRIARYMGVRSMEIGIAGMKDSQACTTQTMSMEYADADKLRRFRDTNIKIVDVTYHTNKLRIGHLSGNKFALRIRGAGASNLAQAKRIMDVLVARGVPNYFGQQRFGSRGDTGLLGAAMVRGDLKVFVEIFLGHAIASDPPDCKAARDAFDAGYYDRALKHWPRHYTDQRHALIAYKRKGSPTAAIAAVDKRLKRLFVSAFQSEIFNHVLARRIDQIDTVQLGDLAEKIDGGVFTVEDLAVEQARAGLFEISPTGPIVGTRCNLAGGAVGQLEQAVLDEFGARMEDFRHIGELHSKGSRRALRFKIESPSLRAGIDGFGQYIELEFLAPPGCYATVLLREMMKNKAVEIDTASSND